MSNVCFIIAILVMSFIATRATLNAEQCNLNLHKYECEFRDIQTKECTVLKLKGTP